MSSSYRGSLAYRLLTVGGDYPTRRYSVYGWLTGSAWVPSHQAKRRHLLDLFRQRGHTSFIEAGTYHGDTVDVFRPHAERIISVELDESLYRRAAERFAGAKNVDIRHGDATDVIPEAVAESPPSLIFLDGHFSGPGTALGGDVEPAPHILERVGAVAPDGTTVVVDDLRLFGTAAGYPDVDALTTAARTGFPHGRVRTGLDSLVVEI